MSKATRWGIAGAGRISADFTRAVHLLSTQEHQVCAVASRRLSSAQDFAREHGIPHAYGSYLDMAQDDNIDVVYVGVIIPQHFPVCKMLLSNRKNVLCEKPLAMNASQVRYLLGLAQDNQVFFMEGLWSRFFPAYDRLRKELQNNTLGDIKLVQIDIGLPVINLPRHFEKKHGAGAALGFGVYGVQLSTMIYEESPQKISATGILVESGVDVADSITLVYSNGRMTHINVHLGCHLRNSATIYGTEGKAQISNVWCPDTLELLDDTLQFATPKIHPMNYVNTGGLSYEAESVRQCLLKGFKENPLMTHRHTQIDFDIMDEIRRQVGITYEEDQEQYQE